LTPGIGGRGVNKKAARRRPDAAADLACRNQRRSHSLVTQPSTPVAVMQLPTEVFGNVIVVHAPEELSTEQAESFEQFLAQATPRQIVLDMDNTETLDSAGLTAMLNSQDRLRSQGGDVKIAASSAVTRKILEITRLDRQLDVFDCVIDAVKSFR